MAAREEEERRKGKRARRRRGGKVEGKKPEHRLDRRARGGGVDEPEERAKGGGVDKWAAAAFKPSHEGELHRALGVPEGEKIPKKKMKGALNSSDEHVRHMAQAAHNINE